MNVLRSLVGKKKYDSGDAPDQNHAPNSAHPHSSHEDDPHDNQEDRKRLWSKLSGLIGKDTTSLVSLPVSMFEPLSVLQSMCEPLRYADIITKVCNADDHIDRICYVASFCVALFGLYNRTLKPFNPILGETYEYVPKDNQYKCLCEQVSHHPPIGIAYTSSEKWTLQQESRIETKFWGNTVDVYSLGANDLKILPRDEHFTWTNPITCIHNIIFGKVWVEPSGSFPLKNLSTGDTCTLHYKKSGWFEGINYEISGEARDKDGNLRAIITGKYNEVIYVAKVDKNGAKSDPVELWRKPVEEITNKWRWPSFVFELTDTNEEQEAILPRSDSRLRADVRALKALNTKLAGKEKNKIEESERHKRKERDAQSIKWNPVYFQKKEGGEKEVTRWQYVGNYWEEKEQRVAQHKAKQSSPPVDIKSNEVQVETQEQQSSPRSP